MPSSQAVVISWRRSKMGLPAAGPTVKAIVASPVATDVAPSKTNTASMVWMSMGTAASNASGVTGFCTNADPRGIAPCSSTCSSLYPEVKSTWADGQ